MCYQTINHKEAFAMTSIAQINENEQSEITGTLKKFFADYKVRDLLKACRAEKQKGHSAFEIFRYILLFFSLAHIGHPFPLFGANFNITSMTTSM